MPLSGPSRVSQCPSSVWPTRPCLPHLLTSHPLPPPFPLHWLLCFSWPSFCLRSLILFLFRQAGLPAGGLPSLTQMSPLIQGPALVTP